jgi:hypothetical protein
VESVFNKSGKCAPVENTSVSSFVVLYHSTLLSDLGQICVGKLPVKNQPWMGEREGEKRLLRTIHFCGGETTI